MEKRSYLYYGLGMGGLLILLQIIHYKALVRDVELEIFGGVIAIIFLGLGLLLKGSVRGTPLQAYHIKKQGKEALLSSREQDVLVLLANGHSNQEISDKLFVSLNTTKTHISNIYSKLGVSRRTQAIQKAKELDILHSPEGMKTQNHLKV